VYTGVLITYVQILAKKMSRVITGKAFNLKQQFLDAFFIAKLVDSLSAYLENRNVNPASHHTVHFGQTAI
jgi:formyltetrahydrofolate hydrolase